MERIEIIGMQNLKNIIKIIIKLGYNKKKKDKKKKKEER
jgi:hypothetical protein